MENYVCNIAYLAVQCGVNVKKGDTVFVSAPVDAVSLAREITKNAYNSGADNVVVNFSDDIINKQKLLNAPDKILETFPQYDADKFLSQLENKSSFCTISIIANDPNIMAEVPTDKFQKVSKARFSHMKSYYEAAHNDEFRWTVISFPTESWAKAAGVTLNELIEFVAEASVTKGSQQDCLNHINEVDKTLQNRCQKLNNLNFKQFKYTTKRTNFIVDMHESHIFLGGSTKTNDILQQKFYPNIPTYEVFSAPLNCNGIIYATRPLSYNGNIISDFYLKFENGDVVDFDAVQGRDILQELIMTDAGSKRLGEIALVSQDSPVCATKFLFLETLFDENASCHFALGSAYTVCGKGEWLNNSSKHVDFMIGDSDLQIIGITKDDNQIVIMQNGVFTIQFQ
ncbi:Thermophilic metalloprotease (M29) family protein [Spironucleus salmonicida]|uniref:Thermophilic metalloprotease (M29) family protein n=1 Tax=Spironucleus salmonicida TaxID=348837 RepID=V6LPK9_9EUKA|nr:Thermophilic metalloprotease (M29) family protein [Spironucleus salmonicida]|eukprot:EST42659.1 Thermophilic metalloprotease (M29) family protein [Spironucleus salmonicida]